jgi:hypothetical protein
MFLHGYITKQCIRLSKVVFTARLLRLILCRGADDLRPELGCLSLNASSLNQS